jgi:hypothetical protein
LIAAEHALGVQDGRPFSEREAAFEHTKQVRLDALSALELHRAYCPKCLGRS